MTLESWVGAVLWPASTARVPLSPPRPHAQMVAVCCPRPLPSGRLPSVAPSLL
ncbi:unnamed protein product, partial [Staurois parvus]